MTQIFAHNPVMLQEVLELLAPAGDKIIVDCTLGGAGHTAAIAKALGPGGIAIGIDQDDDALRAAGERLKDFTNVRLVKGNFGDLSRLLEGPVDGFLFDLGVSSWQLDSVERGFSYQHDAPLDMRMNRDTRLTAAEILATWSQGELTRIFREYGEENWSSRVASFIIRERKQSPITTTGQLVEIIKAAIPAAARRSGPHPARRIFQALRIAVNGELERLEQGLRAAIELCRPQGIIVVISYHSLEDRITKQIFKEGTGGCSCPPDFPRCVCGQEPILQVLTKKPLEPKFTEVEENPRSRSARLRAARRLSSKA